MTSTINKPKKKKKNKNEIRRNEINHTIEFNTKIHVLN